MMRFCLCLLALLSFSIGVVVAEEASSPEEEAVQKIRRWTTNLQTNRDGTVRLIRMSKSGVKDEHLQHLPAFEKLDYLAVVCPEVTDVGLAAVETLPISTRCSFLNRV